MSGMYDDTTGFGRSGSPRVKRQPRWFRAGLILTERLLYVSRRDPGGGRLFCAFLFLLLLALFLQALGRLFLLAFLCYKSFCHDFNIMIINKFSLRVSDRRDYLKNKLKECELQSLLIKN